MIIKPQKNLIKAQKFILGIDRLMADKRRRLELNIAMSLLGKIKWHLRAQDLPWAPLAPEYRQWKEDHGLSTKTWIARGDLMSKIRIIKSPDGLYLVGIDPFDDHYSGLSAYHLAMVHEYGVPDMGIPARPLFRPSYHEVALKYKTIARTADPELYAKYFLKHRMR